MRRLARRQSAATPGPGHHNVYVVLLDDASNRLRKVRQANPDRDPTTPTIHVGLTGLDPEQRFEKHKRGTKSSSLIRRYGLRLLPEFYARLNPMPCEAAKRKEHDLAEESAAQQGTDRADSALKLGDGDGRAPNLRIAESRWRCRVGPGHPRAPER